jgi:hypothetical protein
MSLSNAKYAPMIRAYAAPAHARGRRREGPSEPKPSGAVTTVPKQDERHFATAVTFAKRSLRRQ